MLDHIKASSTVRSIQKILKEENIQLSPEVQGVLVRKLAINHVSDIVIAVKKVALENPIRSKDTDLDDWQRAEQCLVDSNPLTD